MEKSIKKFRFNDKTKMILLKIKKKILQKFTMTKKNCLTHLYLLYFKKIKLLSRHNCKDCS